MAEETIYQHLLQGRLTARLHADVRCWLAMGRVMYLVEASGPASR
jgi:hypothetical protein